MNYYVVIDTNVVVSALLKPGSVPDQVIEHALSGKIIPIFDRNIFDEYEKVVNRPKFHFALERIARILSGIRDSGTFITTKEFEFDSPDPKDKIFYCVLMTAREEVDAYLVTGNLKHFPKEVFIVTPRELLDIIERDGD